MRIPHALKHCFSSSISKLWQSWSARYDAGKVQAIYQTEVISDDGYDGVRLGTDGMNNYFYTCADSGAVHDDSIYGNQIGVGVVSEKQPCNWNTDNELFTRCFDFQ